MYSPKVTLWRLGQGGELCLGPSCNEGGLFLGRTPLLEREGDQFVVRDRHELERVISAGYGCDVALESRMGGFHAVAKALNNGDLCRATVAAVMLRLPDLPNYVARSKLETEDWLAKTEHAKWSKIGQSFDPTKHPRWPFGQSDGGQFRPVNDAPQSQPGTTGEHADPERSSGPSEGNSGRFWPNAASILAAGAVEVVGNIAIGAEEIGTAGAATPAVPVEEAGLAALATEAAETTAKLVGPSSRALGRALEAAGSVRQAGDAAHHIVAGTAAGAITARATLQTVGIGINDAANGVFLQSMEHAAVHTAEYFAAVNRALGRANTKADVVHILHSIAQGLKSGAFP